MLCGLGKLDSYAGALPSTKEVYVLRLTVVGMPMQLISEPLSIIEAVGRALQTGVLWGHGAGMEYDIKGACVLPVGSYVVMDVMLTYDGLGALSNPWSSFKSADSLVVELNADARLKTAFPTAIISSAGWYVLSGSEAQDQISYWQSASILYSHLNGGKTTGAFDTGQNIWYGTAEARQRQWAPLAPAPIGPGSGQKAPSWIAANWYWVGIWGVALVYLYKKQGK